MKTEQIHHCGELEKLVLKNGFLPFFRNPVPGFSVEEATPEILWFKDGEEGPWEWKGPVVRERRCAYGKMINKKAAFVSLDWFPDLVNYRRSIYGLNSDAPQSREMLVYDTVIRYESLLSKDIKAMCGFNKTKKRKGHPFDQWEPEEILQPKKESYDKVIIRLMMGTWLVIADFEYNYDRHGNPYGWGVARYTTPEILYGREQVLCNTHRSPEESRQRLVEHLTRLLPQATPAQINRIIG